MGQTIILDQPKQRVTCPRTQSDGRLRVAFLTPSLGRGGAERWIISLARWMQPELDVIGVVSSSYGGAYEALRPEFERWCPVLLLAKEEADCFALLRTADIVIVWGFAALESYVPRGLRAKVVYVAHGSVSWTADHVTWATPWVDHWAAVSTACAVAFPTHLQSQVTAIHNGADVERTTPVRGRQATRARWGLTEDHIAVTYLGRFSHEKRPEALSQAIINLPENYVGIMAGDGWRETQVREECQAIAGDRVRFVGFDPHVGDVLAASDCWINCSPAEGFSLSLIEAWLAALPCVSTPTGATPELQAAYGPLVAEVPIGADGQTIAAGIRTAISSEFQPITDRARKLAWEQFTAPAMAARWIDYLKAI
jgi:glycosyltransferase involved in cell wall biosynthesis